jgi:hypothetical protein
VVSCPDIQSKSPCTRPESVDVALYDYDVIGGLGSHPTPTVSRTRFQSITQRFIPDLNLFVNYYGARAPSLAQVKEGARKIDITYTITRESSTSGSDNVIIRGVAFAGDMVMMGTGNIVEGAVTEVSGVGGTLLDAAFVITNPGEFECRLFITVDAKEYYCGEWSATNLMNDVQFHPPSEDFQFTRGAFASQGAAVNYVNNVLAPRIQNYYLHHKNFWHYSHWTYMRANGGK